MPPTPPSHLLPSHSCYHMLLWPQAQAAQIIKWRIDSAICKRTSSPSQLSQRNLPAVADVHRHLQLGLLHSLLCALLHKQQPTHRNDQSGRLLGWSAALLDHLLGLLLRPWPLRLLSLLLRKGDSRHVVLLLLPLSHRLNSAAGRAVVGALAFDDPCRLLAGVRDRISALSITQGQHPLLVQLAGDAELLGIASVRPLFLQLSQRSRTIRFHLPLH